MTAKALDPFKPTRSDHRYIRKLLDTFYGGKVVHVPEEYERVVRVFGRAGGSWERLHLGSDRDLTLLKKILKICYDKKLLTHAAVWK